MNSKRNITGKWFGITVYEKVNPPFVNKKKFFICNLQQNSKKPKIKGNLVSFVDLEFNKNPSNEYLIKGKFLETSIIKLEWYSKNINKLNYAFGVFNISNNADKIKGHYVGKSRDLGMVRGFLRMFKRKDDIYLYDVAISFEKNKRDEARKIAYCLKEKGLYVFFDEFENINLISKKLTSELKKVFKTSKYSVILLDENYNKTTIWTSIEQNASNNKIIIDYININTHINVLKRDKYKSLNELCNDIYLYIVKEGI